MLTDTPCFITLVDGLLSAGNAHIQRQWRLEGSALRAESLTAFGRSWITPCTTAGTTPPQAVMGSATLTTCTARRWGIEAEGLHGDLQIGQAHWEISVYPDVASITLRLRGISDPDTQATAASNVDSSGVEPDHHRSTAHNDAWDRCETLNVTCHHAHLRSVALMDRTDHYDNLARIEERHLSSIEHIHLRGCCFVIEDALTHAGLILLKHAPLPHARPAPCAVDLHAHHRHITLLGHGCGDTGEGYAWSLIAYQGGREGCTRALHAQQRCHRPYQPGRDGRLLSNTWGDRNRDGCLTEAFISAEIAAGSALGVDVVQIDDGWQRGITSNSVHRDQGGVWLGFWAADPQFWQPHAQRFPRGLEPIAATARSQNMQFGLWYAPDSANDFALWQRDAEQVLSLHRDLGVTYVKIDGVKARSKRGEGNLARFFAAVLEGSAGAVTFDLDVTAETRPGYFGAMTVGPLFVENRYTDWTRYWPHATLRNLWQLTWWIDPARLRMEFLNPARNDASYGDDPLRPSRYSADYLFATTMIANPLAWFEVSRVGAEFIATAAPLIALWRQHRERLHGGSITPIGEVPSGSSWTGFRSAGTNSIDLLVFRELTPREQWSLTVPEGTWTAEVLYGSAEIGLAGSVLGIRISDELRFAWIRLSRPPS